MKHGVVAVSDNLGMVLELAELAETIAARTVFHKILITGFHSYSSNSSG